MWVTKRSLKKQIANLNMQIAELKQEADNAKSRLEFMNKSYPFELGQVVYDVQLRSSKGRFTKTKASREHSLINEVTVDKKNYFNLVNRYQDADVFKTYEEAKSKIDSVCVE